MFYPFFRELFLRDFYYKNNLFKVNLLPVLEVHDYFYVALLITY